MSRRNEQAPAPFAYQQYDPVTREFYPVPEDKDAYESRHSDVLGLPPGYDAPILEMFRQRDARRARCRVVAIY